MRGRVILLGLPDGSAAGSSPSLAGLIEATAARNPGAVSILAPGRAPLSYGQLHAHAQSVRHALRRLGVETNDRVALIVPDGPELAVAFLTIAASATCAPLSPAMRGGEYAFVLPDLKVRVVVIESDRDSPARDAAHRHGIPVVELAPERAGGAGLFTLTGTGNEESADGGFAAGDDVALVLHTSGTTARPKRVPLTHRNLCASAPATAAAFHLTAQDRCLNLMPLYHAVALQTTLATVAAGASIVCPPHPDADAFFAWLQEFRPSWYSAPPPVHHAILARAEAHRAIIASVPLRFIRSGAGALSPQILEEMERALGAPVIETYGMTEAGHICCGPLPPRPRKAGSVGVTMGPAVAIMNETGTLVPPGTVGEVVVGGPTVTPGYEDHPEANAAAFCHGWFRTGDLGALDEDGYLFLKGRIKELINRGGEKVSPHEVERALLAHSAVAEAVVFPLPHPTLGEEVAAAVVLHPGAEATEQNLRRWAADRVADFKVPRRIVAVEEIPAGPDGKVRRSQLAEHWGPRLRTPYRATETPLEWMLASLWAEELRVDLVGLHDNFFDLGGDSLSATRIGARLTEAIGRSVPVATFIQAPTVAEMARLLRETDAPRALGSCLVPIQTGGTRPPLFCLHGASGWPTGYNGLARHLGQDQPVYGVQAVGAGESLPAQIRFEELGNRYAQEIRAFLPGGPYLLCGYSLAGLLAWEVAQQLHAQGQRVALLALLDTHLYFHPALAPKRAAALEFFFRRVEFHVSMLRELSPYDRLLYVPQRLRARRRQRATAVSSTAEQDPWTRGSRATLVSSAGEISSSFESFQATWRALQAAKTVYLPRPYAGPITLFLARRPEGTDLRYDYRLPRTLATGNVKIVKVPGNHSSIIEEPDVRVLARKLRTGIDRAVRSAGAPDVPPFHSPAPPGDHGEHSPR